MPLTAAEKMSRRREKLKKEGKYEEYKKKMREAVKKSRTKKKKDIEKLPLSQQEKIRNKTRKECKQRVAKYREKLSQIKDQSATCTPDSPKVYKSRNTLGKATKKANRALPNSPRKRKMVVKKLYETFVAAENEEAQNDSTENESRPSTALSLEIINKVTKFYECEEISRQAPGIKDVVIIRDANGSKSKVQARHLLLSMQEMHRLFIEENPDCKIGKSKFFELRPQHVLPSSKLPRNVCLCKYHENYRLATEAFSKFHNSPIFADFSFLCSEKTDTCWYGECVKCSHQLETLLDKITQNENLNGLKWYVWKKDATGKLKKVLEEGDSEDLAKHIKTLMPHFLKHVYTKREQALAYRKQVEAATSESFDPKVAILQIDFAENYTCSYQDEVQSAYWQQKQITIFTVSAWYFGKHHSMALISDNLSHSKETVVPYVSYILEKFPDEVKEINIWSDGPSSQFKNRFIASALRVLESHSKKKLTWNYFASGHGKGPVDGTGGSIKRSVRNAVLKGKYIVTNASEFVSAAQDQPSKINVVELTPAEIEKRSKKLNLSKVFSEAPLIESIKMFHHLRTQGKETEGFYLVKDFEKQKTEIKAGDYYMVEYEESLYPAVVTLVEDNEYKVKVMVAAGTYWKWPEHEDAIFYKEENMKKRIDPPTLVNSRGHYKFN